MVAMTTPVAYQGAMNSELYDRIFQNRIGL